MSQGLVANRVLVHSDLKLRCHFEDRRGLEPILFASIAWRVLDGYLQVDLAVSLLAS